jgi:hypothetical protein
MGKPKKKDAPPIEFGPYGTPSFFAGVMDDEEELSRFVKSVEGLARRSMELREYIRFLKEEVHMDHCHFLRGVSSDLADIEIHHHPLNLFEITEIVIRAHMCNERETTSTLLMAQEIVELHYDGLVGLVPLTKTIHELVHSGKLHVPPTAVWGNIAGFVERYKNHLSVQILSKLDKLTTADNVQWNIRNAEVLAERPVFNPRALLTVDGPIPELPEPVKALKQTKLVKNP